MFIDSISELKQLCNESLRKEIKELERQAELGNAVEWYVEKYSRIPDKSVWDVFYKCWCEESNIRKVLEAYRQSQKEVE